MTIRAAVDGRSVLTGEVAPLPGIGRIGDFYRDTVANLEYGPKTAAGWGTGRSTVGPRGIDGWTRVTRFVPRDADVVEQVIDWTGGEGTKPATGVYIGGASATGYVENIIDAANVRGPAGTLSNIDDLTDAGAVAFADGAPITQAGTAKRATVGAIAAMGLLSFDNKAQAEGKSIPTTLVKTIFLRAYEDIGDGGRAHYKLVGDEPAHDLWIQTADGAFWEIDEPFVTPQMGGAKADGETDDSAAIQRVNDFGRPVFFPPGVYAANALTQTVSWDMHPQAKILYNGDADGVCLTLNASGIESGYIHIDCDGAQVNNVYRINGDDNKFTAPIFVENLTSSTAIAVGVVVTGSQNSATVHLKNFVNDEYWNDSSPQGLTLGEDANGNSFPYVHSVDGRAVVVDNSTGRNFYGYINAVDCKDNAFYGVNANHATVGIIHYDGDNNVAGFRSGANATIGAIHAARCGNPVFFGDCGNVTIDHLDAPNCTGPIIGLNEAAAGKIWIKNITGTVHNNFAIFMPAENGPVEYLTIDHADIKVVMDADSAFSTRSLVRLDACKGLCLGDVKIDVIFDGYTPVNPFYTRIKHDLTYMSVIDSYRVGFFEDDGITPATATYFTTGFDGTNTLDLAQGLLRIKEGGLLGGIIRAYTDAGYHPGRLVKASVPTTGTWLKGDIVWAESPINGIIAWVCTFGGTPGTWAAIGSLVGSATFNPGSLADGDGVTTTVAVAGAKLGDFAVASFSVDLQGITLTAWVSSADTVSVRFQNESGGVLDLPSATLRVRVSGRG